MFDLLVMGLILIGILTVAYHFTTGVPETDGLGVAGKVIWIDIGKKTTPFFNNTFSVLGKPDLMYKVKGGILAVEYKDRGRGIYNSDIVQAKCAALAARGEGFKVIRVLIKNRSEDRYIELPPSDHALYKQIERYILLSRKAKNGEKMQAQPERHKCRACSLKLSCQYAD